MHEYRYWSALSVKAFVAAGGLLVGCGSATHPDERPAPEYLTIEELAFDYKNRVGEEVILEGRLMVTGDGKYTLGRMTGVGRKAEEFQLKLKFAVNNLDIDRMNRCVAGRTLVAGILQKAHEVEVEYVKLTSDARAHRPDSCYHHMN